MTNRGLLAGLARKVGGEGTGLVVDSTQNDGQGWANRWPVVGYTPGFYYPTPTASTLGSVTPTLSEARAIPFVVFKTTTFDRMLIIVISTTGTSVCRLGIYADTGVGGPGALILDAGTVDCGTATGVQEATISQLLNPGVYWLVGVMQTATTAIRNQAFSPFKYLTASAAPINYPASVIECYIKSGVTGALPALFASTSGAGSSSGPGIFLRAV